jgi:hypothetical protein
LAALLALVLLTACDSELVKVGKGLAVTAESLEAFGNVIKESYAAKQITADEAKALAELNIKLNQGGIQVNSYVKTLAQIDPESKGKVIQYIKPWIPMFQEAIDKGLIGIKNPTVVERCKLILQSAQTTLTILTATLEGK